MNIYVYNSSELELLQSFIEEKLETDFNFNLPSEEENFIVFLIKNKIASFSSITFKTKKEDTFIYKIDIRHITEPEERISFPFLIQNNQKEKLNLSENKIKDLVSLINGSTYSFNFYFSNAEDLYISEKQKRLKETEKRTKQIDFFPKVDLTYKNISEPHLKAQYILREIAGFIGYDCFIAKNDQNKIFRNEFLSKGTLNTIPYEKIPKESKKIISLIDVIWFKNNHLKAAFEIETSTSVYSALLRFSDIAFSLTSLPVDFYIVTTKDRKRKIKKELNRPIFKQTGISQRCKVIFLDELENLYSLAKPLKSYLKSNILDRISYEFSYFDDDKSNQKQQSV